MPFSFAAPEEAEDSIIAFAAAPKLTKDCHRLGGHLTSLTKEIPDALRTKDFEARQTLLGALTLHESSRLGADILSQHLPSQCQSDRSRTHVKNVGRLQASYNVPTAQAMINNALSVAKTIRNELRTKAVQGMKNQAARVSLTEGGLFSPSLFSASSIKVAEECIRTTPAPVIVQVAAPTAPQPRGVVRPRGQSSHRGSALPRGSFTPRGTFIQSFRSQGAGPFSGYYAQPSFHQQPRGPRGRGNSQRYQQQQAHKGMYAN